MKNLCFMLIAGLFTVSASVQGQVSIQRSPDSSVKTPAEPGMRSDSDRSMKAPSNSGIVVVPPKTGAEEAVVTPPKNVDPEITAPTEEIDRKNKKKSEEKEKSR